MASDAVGLERVSRVVGYKITKGNFSEVSPNLPQRVAILGEANEANQAGLVTAPTQITSAQQAGTLYGFGSPIHQAARILFPQASDGIGGIPVYVYAQAKAVGATAKVVEVTPTGNATGNGTHTLVIAGRKGVDAVFYDINIVTGDTPAIIGQKMEDAVNAVLGSPVIADFDTDATTFTSKWAGLTSQDLTVTVDTNGNSLGVTYAALQLTAGAGTPTIAAALALFGNDWNTIVLNGYGIVTSIVAALEAFNGRPDPLAPTGRYAGIVMKPFVAITGTVADDNTSFTNVHEEDVTIALAPAPGSKGFPIEAAANMVLLAARCAQDTPHLDIGGRSYPDMPTPATIGSMATYNNRDAFVKKGSSTVDLVAGRYQVQDFVTTYHPEGELIPQFRYVRNIFVDLNIRFAYYLKEQQSVVGNAIANDEDVVTLVSGVVKPKMFKQVVRTLAEELTARALIVDTDFMKDSITVSIGTSNPDRLETFFRYKRSGVARISSTTAEAGFNTGNLN